MREKKVQREIRDWQNRLLNLRREFAGCRVTQRTFGDELGRRQIGKVGVDFADAPGLKRRTLIREGWICLARKDHPALTKGLDLATFVGLTHALCSPRSEGAGIVDKVLADRGYSRKIAFSTRYFIVAAMVAARTDLILTMPRRSGLHLAATLGLEIYEPPIQLPDLNLVALWHERMDDAPAHRWLRQTLFSLF